MKYTQWDQDRPWHQGPGVIKWIMGSGPIAVYLSQDRLYGYVFIEYRHPFSGRFHRLNGPAALRCVFTAQPPYLRGSWKWSVTDHDFKNVFAFLDAAHAYQSRHPNFGPDDRSIDDWTERILAYECLPIHDTRHPIWEDVEQARTGFRRIYRRHECVREAFDRKLGRD